MSRLLRVCEESGKTFIHPSVYSNIFYFDGLMKETDQAVHVTSCIIIMFKSNNMKINTHT